MKHVLTTWLGALVAAALLGLLPPPSAAQSDKVVFPPSGGTDTVKFPDDANAGAEAELRSDEVKPPEKQPKRETAPPAENRPPEVADLTLANRSTDTIWLETSPEKRVISISVIQRVGSQALLAGDLQKIAFPAGEYAMLVEGTVKGAPIGLLPGRAYMLEFQGSLDGSAGLLTRLSQEGQPVFETVLRPLLPPPAIPVTVVERRICSHCGELIYHRRVVQQTVAQTPPALQYRWICEDCERVFAGPGACPECDEGLAWRLVGFRCPVHEDVVTADPNAACWRCGGATAELFVAGD